jgi:hypothetical protein
LIALYLSAFKNSASRPAISMPGTQGPVLRSKFARIDSKYPHIIDTDTSFSCQQRQTLGDFRYLRHFCDHLTGKLTQVGSEAAHTFSKFRPAPEPNRLFRMLHPNE